MQTTLLSTTITAAETATVVGPTLMNLDAARGVLLQGNFTYGSNGTTLKCWVQSSADGGSTWYDVACFAFTTATKKRLFNLSARTPVSSIATPTDGTMSDDTSVDGLLGDRLRVKYTSTGTYAGGSTVVISAVPR